MDTHKHNIIDSELKTPRPTTLFPFLLSMHHYTCIHTDILLLCTAWRPISERNSYLICADSVKGFLSKGPDFKEKHSIAPHITGRTELVVLQSLETQGYKQGQFVINYTQIITIKTYNTSCKHIAFCINSYICCCAASHSLIW